MLDTIFNSAITDGTLTISTSIITLATSLLLGIIISVTYMKTYKQGTYTSGFSITLIMLPTILSVIILFVGSNVARAFSLAGTLSIIRFRSAPGDPKDIGYIFFAMAAGLACGVGLYAYGALFTIFLCTIMIILHLIKFGERKVTNKKLKIVIPEDLNYEDVFDDIFLKYTQSNQLIKVKTTDLGSLYELEYMVRMNSSLKDKDFIDELRCRNGNLNIVLSLAEI